MVAEGRGIVADAHHDAGTEGHPGAEVVEQRALAHFAHRALGQEGAPGRFKSPPRCRVDDDHEPGHKVGNLRAALGFLDSEACTPRNDSGTPN